MMEIDDCAYLPIEPLNECDMFEEWEREPIDTEPESPGIQPSSKNSAYETSLRNTSTVSKIPTNEKETKLEKTSQKSKAKSTSMRLDVLNKTTLRIIKRYYSALFEEVTSFSKIDKNLKWSLFQEDLD